MTFPEPEWTNDRMRLAALAEYMFREDWPADEVVRMLRRPLDYSAEYAELCSYEEGTYAALNDSAELRQIR